MTTEPSPISAGPLARIKVLDLCIARAGPTCVTWPPWSARTRTQVARPDGPTTTLRLTETRTTMSGVTVNRYEPAGEVMTGSFDDLTRQSKNRMPRRPTREASPPG